MLPAYVKKAINVLKSNGFEAYAVGGCVRDMLLSREVNDYDVTTSAMPEEIKMCFKDLRCIETGIKHGTISVIVDGEIIEITTYRIDGKYTDNRHPETVEFTKNLKDDLKRRDFTINAMAYDGNGIVIDCFEGKKDLQNKIIRCVGDAKTRFREDALRILRALRFSAKLGFEIEKDTKKAIFSEKKLLLNIAAERIREEFCGIIEASGGAKVICEYISVFEVFIPELGKIRGIHQHNKAHIYDVFIHSIKALEACENNLYLRLCMLFHDIGKFCCMSIDEKGNGHFYGHQRISANITKEILKRLRFDNKTIDTVAILVTYHDGQIAPDEKSVRRWLKRLGEENLRLLLKVKKSDAASHEKNYAMERIEEIEKIKVCLNGVIEKKLCYNLKMLAFTGEDAIDAGFSGKGVGVCLEYLLCAVIENRCENERSALMEVARKYKEKYDKKSTGR